jgi:superfamily II DNA or RNA helicase
MDRADRQLELYFGPTIFKLAYQDAQELGLVVPIKVRWLHVNTPTNPCEGLQGVRKTEHGIWKNQARNQVIARDIRENFPDVESDQILILVSTVTHAIQLWQLLPEFSLCFSTQNADDIRKYKRQGLLPANFRDVTPSVREDYRKRFVSGELRRVIATDVWATGVDFRGLSVLYRADARSSEIKSTQAPGRVARTCPEKNKTEGHLIDCYDFFDKGFRRKSDERRRIYETLGWQQINLPTARRGSRPRK